MRYSNLLASVVHRASFPEMCHPGVKRMNPKVLVDAVDLRSNCGIFAALSAGFVAGSRGYFGLRSVT